MGMPADWENEYNIDEGWEQWPTEAGYVLEERGRSRHCVDLCILGSAILSFEVPSPFPLCLVSLQLYVGSPRLYTNRPIFE
jgi:hypothetical protein